MNFLIHLREEWEAIRKTPFACLLCLAIGFAAGSWYYAERVATLASQVAFWKDKASAAAPTTPTPVFEINPAAPVSPGHSGNSSAHFTLNALGASFFTSPGNASLTGIILDVQITNSGLPGIATGWRLTVTPKRGDPVAAQYFEIPKAPLTYGDPPQVLRKADSLADRTLKKLPYEKPISGRLLFYAPLPLTTVQDPSTTLTLTVQDAAGDTFPTGPLKVGDWLGSRN